MDRETGQIRTMHQILLALICVCVANICVWDMGPVMLCRDLPICTISKSRPIVIKATVRELLCAEFKAGIPRNFLDFGGNYGEFIGV